MEFNVAISIPDAYAFLFEPMRYKVLYGGRGGGKSWAVADALLLLGCQKPLRILCARELQISMQDSVHRLLCDRIEALNLDGFYKITQKSIEGLNGTMFLFKGLKHNYREIKSTEGVDICWVEEAENVAARSWEVLIPTIRKEVIEDGVLKQSEIWITFNTKNVTDATYSRFVINPPKNSIVKKVSWRDNPFFPEVLDIERVDMMIRDPEAYGHIWEGEPDTRYSGAVYAKEMAALHARGHLSPKVEHDPDYPVYTLWDLGFGDTCVIWFYQVGPNEILLIDYYENNGEGIGHYCDVMKGMERDANGLLVKSVEHERFSKYNYGAHYVPQDAGKKLMESGGKSIVEQAWKDHDVRMTILPETTHANRHSSLRALLPKMWFNSERCAAGISALMAYHYVYSEDMQRFGKDPHHDWSSHACFIGSTMVISSRGLSRIDSLPLTGEVLTPCGWKQYHSPRITKRNASLVEVVFKDGLTVKCTPDHLFLTVKGWRYAKHLTPFSGIVSTLTKSPNILMGAYTAYGRQRHTLAVVAKSYIGMYGEVLLGIYQKVVISITKTEIQPIINSKIWNVCQLKSIWRLLGNKMKKFTGSAGLVRNFTRKETNGLILKQESYKQKGILLERKNGQNGLESITHVSIAEQYLKPLEEKAAILKNTAPMIADLLHIDCVRKLKEKSDVWCMSVPYAECFSLENGAVVHNSTALELLPRAHGKAITIKQIEKKTHLEKFLRARKKSGQDHQDPYRVKKLRSKK